MPERPDAESQRGADSRDQPALIRAREPRDTEDLAAVFACPGVVAGALWLPLRSTASVAARFDAADANSHALVAEVEGRVVGTLGLHVAPQPRRRHVGEIGMAVHDDVQGRGIGRALLAAALDLADNWLGLRRIELHVYADNAAAVRLYARAGFGTEGVARAFAFRDGAFVDALRMARVRGARQAVGDNPPDGDAGAAT